MNRSDDLIEQYLYDVVRRLPEKQKKDIEQELRTLIDDMIAEREEAGNGNREEITRAVLNELGNPAKLAKGYRGEHDCLIGGEYYDSYCYITKIVLICTAAGILISNIVSAIVHVVEAEGMTGGIWEDMSNIGSIPIVLVSVFGFITLVYALMERNHVKVSPADTGWSLEKLPRIPSKKAVISRGESAVGVVFGVLFAVLFVFAPHLVGFWVKENGMLTSVPLFNLAIWGQVLPLFLVSVSAGILDDFVKLVSGKYTNLVMAVTIISDTVSFALTFLLIKMYPIWNADFVLEVEELTGKMVTSKGDIFLYFNTDTFGNIILVFLLCCFLLDIGTTVYYTVRYGENEK